MSIPMVVLGDSPLRTVQSCAAPMEIWSRLQKRYVGRTSPNYYDALFNLLNNRYDERMYMADHLENLELKC